jgi:hypothetical protein
VRLYHPQHVRVGEDAAQARRTVDWSLVLKLFDHGSMHLKHVLSRPEQRFYVFREMNRNYLWLDKVINKTGLSGSIIYIF